MKVTHTSAVKFGSQDRPAAEILRTEAMIAVVHFHRYELESSASSKAAHYTSLSIDSLQAAGTTGSHKQFWMVQTTAGRNKMLMHLDQQIQPAYTCESLNVLFK